MSVLYSLSLFIFYTLCLMCQKQRANVISVSLLFYLIFIILPLSIIYSYIPISLYKFLYRYTITYYHNIIMCYCRLLLIVLSITVILCPLRNHMVFGALEYHRLCVLLVFYGKKLALEVRRIILLYISLLYISIIVWRTLDVYAMLPMSVDYI